MHFSNAHRVLMTSFKAEQIALRKESISLNRGYTDINSGRFSKATACRH